MPNFSNKIKPHESMEVADFTVSDYVFENVPSYLNCSADGKLMVDMIGEGKNVALYVTFGSNNPGHITKIYNVGSDPIIVSGCI